MFEWAISNATSDLIDLIVQLIPLLVVVSIMGTVLALFKFRH